MKKIITEAIVNELANKGVKVIPIKKGDIVTPLAKDRINQLKLELAFVEDTKKFDTNTKFSNDIKLSNKLIIGYDNFSSSYIQNLPNLLKKLEYQFDLLECLQDSHLYGDLTKNIVEKLSTSNYKFGIIFLEDGLGANIIANRNKGIRAVNVIEPFGAKISRLKYNANLLIISTGFVGYKVTEEIISVWLTTNFGGGANLISLKED